MTATLIETDSPLYLKRLVRELNSLPDGFYLMQSTGDNVRCRYAQYSKLGVLVVTLMNGSPRYIAACKSQDFCDCYGRNVYASRKA